MRYISSQMSGIPDYNKSRFYYFAYLRRKRGIEVYNPAEEEVYTGDWAKVIADDLVALDRECTEFEPFGTWMHSYGAVIEFLVACKMDKKIIGILPNILAYVIRWWMKPVDRKIRWEIWDWRM